MSVIVCRKVFAIALLGCLAAAPAARAGVVDSPLPVLQAGAPTQLVYTIPGVVKNNNIETLITCTSLESSSVTVAVEVFGDTGGAPLNDAATPSLDGAETILPGGTATIATGATVAHHEDEIIDALLPASVRNGSARVVSTSKKIACSAFITDEINDPPSGMASLKVIAKTKQRGE